MPKTTLPSLTEAVKRLLTDDRNRRACRIAAPAGEGAPASAGARSRDAAAFGWDASPISTARLCAELWTQIKDDDWSLVWATTFVSKWPQRLWNFDKHYQYIGDAGGYGIGYGAPAATAPRWPIANTAACPSISSATAT